MLGKKTASLLTVLSATTLLSLAPAPAQAEMTFTRVEWEALPDLCRSAILISIYINAVPFELRGSAGGPRPSIGGQSYGGIIGAHHFCAGLIYLNRAKVGHEKYDMAISEFKYSYSQMNRGAPLFSYVSANLGRAYYGARKKNDANKVWSEAIALQPERRESYLAMAEALLAERRPDEALKVLQRYEEKKETDYPDAEHFLAETYFELKRYPEAKEHAERAYALGYPVFGLRERMKQLGKW